MPPTRRLRTDAPAVQRRRLGLVAALALAGYAVLALRATQLQALDSEWLRAAYERQSRSLLRLGPLRGEIVDRHGALLAVSADAESVAASPRRIENTLQVSRALARDLGLPRREVAGLLGPARGFVWIKRWVTPAEAQRVRDAALPGVSLEKERRRFYPSRDLGAAYLGFVGRDGQGLSGIELAFEDALRGASAELPVMRDPRGRQLVQHWEGDLEARAGARLVLALDSKLQHYAEAVLDRALIETGARNAVVVALDPRSGDLLALAERPSFNPNRFWLERNAAFRARAFSDPFEPGSTLKPFAVAVALEAGVVRENDRFDCEGGSWRVADRVIHDHKRHGVLSVADIVRVSSNIGVAKIADRLGSERLVEGLRGFGFGRRTQAGFPGESPGVLRSIRAAQVVERSNLSFGQGMTATAVQIAAAYAALANGGRRVVPRLALRLERGSEVLEFPPAIGERVISERTAKSVLRMLRDVVADGSGTEAALPYHDVAGKTGTAQKVVGGRYSPDRYVASFLGIVPASDPRLVILVVLDEPRGVRFGGVVAAPVFREVAGYAVEQLGLPRGAG